MPGIRESIEQTIQYLAENPERGRGPDRPATAVLAEGLRCRVADPDGRFTAATDMPEALGGAGSAPTPGWLLRAALASCEATVIAMRAAQEGIALDALEVTVESESDQRGLLGSGDAPAGPSGVRTRVRLVAAGVDPERLHGLVAWAEGHSPVCDAIRRSVPVTVEVELAEPSVTAPTP
jgi:uncharacterized OsmC-like protein